MSGLVNGTVMWLTWRQLFARKRVWIAIVFSLAPLLFTLVFKVVGDPGDSARISFFGGLCREIIIGTLLPLAAVIFGTTAFGGEVDDGTLVYLLVKPIARWTVVLSKLVVAILSTFAIMIPAMLLPWLMLRGPDLPARVPLSFLAGAAAGAAIYCALFVTLGLVNKRALVVGLVYVIGFEGVLSRNLTGVKSLSVREFAVAVSQAASNGAIKLPGYVVPMSTVWWMGTIMLVGATAWTMRKLVRYELAERL
jgi:ABC-2 type transport system permease protein